MANHNLNPVGNPEHFVTVCNGERMSPVLGPFLTEMQARAALPKVRDFLEANGYPDDLEYGVFRVRSYGRKLNPGRLNKHLGY